MKIGLALNPNEPFGLYSLKMAKADSDASIKPYKEHLKRRQMWREAGFSIISMAFVIGWSALAGINV